MEDSIRSVRMDEEERVFSMIRACCARILKIMKDDEVVSFWIKKKQRIDPTNYAEIIEQCEKVLPEDQLQVVRQLKKAIDSSVSIIVERYMKWGLAQGEKEGARIGVDPIESKSCACMALYRAAFTYDPGNGFANYAPFWIRQLIQKSVDNRMMTTVDNPIGGDDGDGNETMKDRIAIHPRFEPTAIVEDNQMSDIFRTLLTSLPKSDRQEIQDWWYSDDQNAEVSPKVRQFAIRMHQSSN